MNKIPTDAIHWDSGDWIDWHRQVKHPASAPCTAPSEEPHACLYALRTSLLQNARAFLELTGDHLPIYDAIARIHAIIALDLPLKTLGDCEAAFDVEVIVLPPHAPGDSVRVDLSKPFSSLVVVRIAPDFTTQVRIIARTALPQQRENTLDIDWHDLPAGD